MKSRKGEEEGIKVGKGNVRKGRTEGGEGTEKDKGRVERRVRKERRKGIAYTGKRKVDERRRGWKPGCEGIRGNTHKHLCWEG